MRILISVTVLILLCATCAQAQHSGRVVADIPFGFYLGDTYFAGGKYLARSITNSSLLLLEGYPARANAVTSQINTIVPKLSAADDIKLVFLKYDEDHYFLREIYVGTGMGWLTPRSRTEREHVRSKVQFPVAQVQRVTVMASLR